MRPLRLRLSLAYLGGLGLYLVLRWLFGDMVWWLSLLNTFALYLFVPLPLAVVSLIFDDRRWTRLGASVIAVFATLVLSLELVPQDLGRAAETVDPAQSILSVISYNMRVDPAGFEAYLRQEPADVVFVQENADLYAVLGAEALSDLYPYQFSSEAAWGSMVLSKYPITDAQTLSGFGSSLPQRVVVAIEGRAVALYNVHLTWPIGEPRFGRRLPFNLEAWTRYDASTRDTQLKRLEALLQEETLPFLIVGDFHWSQGAG